VEVRAVQNAMFMGSFASQN